MWRCNSTAAVLAISWTAALTMARPVLAQVERSGGGGASQKIMQEYQQLAAERTVLQAKVAQTQKDLDSVKTDLAAMKKERDQLKAAAGATAGAVAQAQAGKKAADENIEQYKQRMAELVSKFREVAQNLKDAEADRGKLRTGLSESNSALDTCAENNLQLYEITSEVLNRYEHVGLFTKVGASEPFTKITRTRIENLVDDYRARADELRLKKHAAGAASQPQAK